MADLPGQLSSITQRYWYDPTRGLYYDRQVGDYVSPEALRRVIDAVIHLQIPKVRRLTDQLINGEISLAEWQTQVLHALMTLYLGVALIALGGMQALRRDTHEWVVMQTLLKTQFTYFRELSTQIYTGQQPLNGTLTTRIGLYVQASRAVYEATYRTKQPSLYTTEEKRVLGIAEHCQDCLDEAAKGWQPIGTLRDIGDSLCLSNCHCRFIYQ